MPRAKNTSAVAKSTAPPKAKKTTKAKKHAKAKQPAKMEQLVNGETGAIPYVEEVEVPFSKFTLFLKLPLELRLMIWTKAIYGHGRIITLRASKFPGIYQACSESRREAIKAGYQFHLRDMKSGMVISPKLDIFFLSRDTFPTDLEYHINAFHTLLCRQTKRSILKPIQRLALSIQEILAIWNTQCFHCFLLKNFHGFFPQVKELIVFLRPGSLSSGYDDLYEVTDIENNWLQSIIDDVKHSFKSAQQEGSCKGIELKFMRMEKWVN